MTEPVYSTESGQPEICPCGHPLDRHDAIASRYCSATASGNLMRGCICAAETAVLAGKKQN